MLIKKAGWAISKVAFWEMEVTSFSKVTVTIYLFPM